MISHPVVRTLAALCVIAATVTGPASLVAGAASRADSAAARACCALAGTVRATDGTPLGDVDIDARGRRAAHTRSAADGTFTLALAPGVYRVSATVRGYVAASLVVDARSDRHLAIALEAADSPQLRRIGSISVDGRLAANAGALPAIDIPRAELDRLAEPRIVDALARLPGATFSRPDGGNDSAVVAVSLRGPDPSESLVALDGQLLNDGNTGDLDVSRLPSAAFSAIDVTEGLGAQDTNGSNTFGGSIDLVSLRPTRDPHVAASLSDGSFGRSEAWLNATGTAGRLGYALALVNDQEHGYVDTTVPLFASTDATCAPCATHLGSAVSARLVTGTLSWRLGLGSDVTARVFALADRRDQSAAVNGIDANAADAGTAQFGAFVGPGEQTFAQGIRAYQLRARTPLGAGELSADLSRSDNTVDVTGAGASPYDIDHRDVRDNLGLTWGREFAGSQFSIGGYERYESLEFVAPPAAAGSALPASAAVPRTGQTIFTAFARGGFDATRSLHVDLGAFESHYSTFGSNLDGRLGLIDTLDPATSVRFSLGTGFRAPLLAERYVLPYAQLALDGNNVFNGQGSTGEVPEHATEYELGVSHRFPSNTTLDVSLYRTNLRNPVEVFYPLAAVAAGTCAGNSYATPIAACVSSVSNVGNAVYTGTEIRLEQRLTRELFATASYGLNVAYPMNLNAQFSNPTSGGNLIDNRQFLGIPQQQGSFEIDYGGQPWHASTTAIARGKNNELNSGPFAIVNATVGRKLDTGLDLTLAATNLFNAAAGRFTIFGAGVPYAGVVANDASGAAVSGPLPTDALRIEPLAINVLLTIRR